MYKSPKMNERAKCEQIALDRLTKIVYPFNLHHNGKEDAQIKKPDFLLYLFNELFQRLPRVHVDFQQSASAAKENQRKNRRRF